jgi:class 3 adenylate cyclase
MIAPPTGTVTFLFTDIEGSTRLWEEDPEAMGQALARHDALLREAIEGSGGYVFKTMGDSFCAAFASAAEAAQAAVAAQMALWTGGPASIAAKTQRAQRGLEEDRDLERVGRNDPGSERHDGRSSPSVSSSRPLRLCGESESDPHLHLSVRVALHTGQAELRDGDYFGAALSRVARILTAGHGGQVLLSGAAREALADHLPAGATLRPLGVHRLRDLQHPESIFQLLHPELPAEFPPLLTLNDLPHNLPQQTTRFIGRERDMAEVRRLLAGSRLLTITGSGGTGKTRLALQVAAELVGEEPDGVWQVELASLSDPDLVPGAVVGSVSGSR